MVKHFLIDCTEFSQKQRQIFIFTRLIIIAVQILVQNEPAHDKIYNKICEPAKMDQPAQSDQSLLIAWTVYSLQAIQSGINENPCQTGWMYRLF